MSQFNWTYLAPSGKKHHVGLFHGDRTGHVLIYCNSKIVLVDFKVRDTKSYSIFIEDELCEIGIERQKDRFVYGFDINKEVDTPLNRERKRNNKKHLRQGLALLGVLAILITVAVISLSKVGKDSGQPSLASLLASSGKETNAKVFLSDSEEATYNFVANGKVYSDKTPFKLDVSTLLQNGMPLEDGDEFLVKYSSTKPELNKIQFNRPTPHQIGIYKKRATDKYLQLHPEENLNYCNCLTDIAYEIDGVNGYAKFYLQDLSFQQNRRYNSDSFHKLIRSEEYQQKVENRCADLK